MTGTVDGGRGSGFSVPPMMDAVRRADREPLKRAPAPRREPSDDEDDDEEAAGHWGIFGPETVTWRIHSDPLIGLATLRSLALRSLHPEGLTSIFATARRVDDPWDRLTWASRHLGVITFGSSAEAAIASARMRAVLMQVQGVTANGNEYRGDDPDLLLWLHCCQVASLIEVTRRGGLELSDDEHETYIREQLRMAALWGLEPDQVPSTRNDLTRYFRSVRPRLRMTSTARAFIGAIVAPALPELMALTQRNRPSWAPVAGLAFPALPGWARRLYSSPPSSGPAALSQSATTVALHTLRDSLRGRGDQPNLALT